MMAVSSSCFRIVVWNKKENRPAYNRNKSFNKLQLWQKQVGAM